MVQMKKRIAREGKTEQISAQKNANEWKYSKSMKSLQTQSQRGNEE